MQCIVCVTVSNNFVGYVVIRTRYAYFEFCFWAYKDTLLLYGNTVNKCSMGDAGSLLRCLDH